MFTRMQRDLFASRLVLVLLSVCTFSGCYSLSLMQEPANLPRRAVRVATAVDTVRIEGDHKELALEAQLRYGITDRVELSLKHMGLGGSAGLKVRLLDTGKLRLAALAGTTLAQVDSQPYSAAGTSTGAFVKAGYVSVLSGVRVLPWLDIMAAPDLHVGRREGDGADGAFIAAGGRGGIALHVTPNLSIIPECAALHVLAGPSPTNNPLFARDDTRFQCGLSVSVGSRAQ